MVLSSPERTQAWRPTIIDSDEEVHRLSESKPELTFVDAFSRQLRELFLIENLEFLSFPKTEAFASSQFKNFSHERRNSYTHVYYPWNGSLVKCLNAEDYFTLRTNRNRDLITPEEQKILTAYRVAVFGMSVGSNIALVLAQAGISRRMTVADLDELDTTNLNRTLAGVHEVGLNKAIVTARRIYEGNPFAEVSLIPEGVTEEKIERLLLSEEADCIVDEIDDIALKIKLRVLAMKYRVPVVMVTDNGDGVVLHIERYDLGHDKIFGQPSDHFAPIFNRPMTKERAGQVIISEIVGGPERVDPQMIASVKKVLNHELVSWSQLGSAAVLGAAMCTVAIKQIVLGKLLEPDIRAYINPFAVEVSSHSVPGQKEIVYAWP